MNRRQAIRTMLFSAMASCTVVAPIARGREIGQARIQKPHRLSPGSRVGLVAPASNAVENEEIRFAVEVIRSLGFKVKEGSFCIDETNTLLVRTVSAPKMSIRCSQIRKWTQFSVFGVATEHRVCCPFLTMS